MKLLTEDALLNCKHVTGVVGIVATQSLLTINGRKVLVEQDPEGQPIVGCPNVGATIKPCLITLKATEGYSTLLRVNQRQVCLDTITGITDGTPPSTVTYEVRHAGQSLVDAIS